ncbi:RHS repeat-associated core domain-containing protein [Sphingobacterium haloxyli]|uniref:Endonuclease n=1 Tax=Sphingobacterium haloxyli TaxID=2100533 RepID=A0A2S9J3B5_9SPHI|nr:RHS repeat-associated core domain-containing protein [Sphingobacterium haloxyli]PRD47252.1 endonuclease [Sphingobacterium haloxyli]
MKALISIFLFLLPSTAMLFAQENTQDTIKRSIPDLEKWTEGQIVQWEDSLQKALYPEPTIEFIPEEGVQALQAAPKAKAAPLAFNNNHVPNSYPVDTIKDVGEIPMSSSPTPTGAKMYTVPIEISPGRQGFQPQLSLVYNSLGGNGTMGMGWSIGGLSSITRSVRSKYYDSQAHGVNLSKADAFVLDGIRLIKLSETSTQIRYETEQGLIKVTAFLSGSVIQYFEVSYPDGNKAVFGTTTNTVNRLSYPLTSLTDLRGNTITYSYVLSNNHYYINSITYTGAEINFRYATTRPDPVVNYEGGLKVTNSRLLQKIDCKSGGGIFRSYELTYQTQTRQNVSTLTQIGSTASGNSLNPLRFYYGEGNTATAYTKAETQLLEWYNFTQPGELIVSKGKFDYGTDDDGLISLPNKNPYWQHYRHSTAFRRSQNRYDNHYSGTEKIFLYAGLNSSFASPMPNLTTETGFTDIFCANIDGKYEEEVIKVNNTVSGSNDRLQFKVYSVNLYTGLALKYTRVFNFPTVLTDADGGKSIHPKLHLTGDFNGNGKIEVLSVSNQHPFGWTNIIGRCYLFDLETGSKLYDGAPLVFYREFVGVQQPDPVAAAQNSDRLFAFDYDGDGKTDICLITNTGTYIYTFDVNGSSYSVRHVATYAALKKSTLAGRQLLLGEFNGDGKPDFLLTPQTNGSDWAIYYSMGNGQFERVAVSITNKGSTEEILVQDVNSDGLTDVIKKTGSSGFFTYLNKPGVGFSVENYSSFVYSGAALVPTNINSRNYFHQLVALKNGKVTRFSFPRNDTKEKQLTGAINSFGVVEKNYYLMLNEAYDHYSMGSGAVYPFENFNGPFSVVVNDERYVNGQRDEHRGYYYENAVIHKEGLGFRGFGRITTSDYLRGRSYLQEYDPYNFGILKVDDSPGGRTTNTWSVNVQSNKIAKIRLTGKSVLNRLTNQTVTSTYLHDTYGNVTKATVNYGGGLTMVTDQTYYNSNSGSIYLIGQPLVKTVTNTRGGSSWIDKETFTYNTVRLPATRLTHTGTAGNQKTGETRWTYDTYGNVLSELSAPYNVTEFLGDTYTYDAAGRYIATVTNALSQTTTYSNYDPYGNPRTVRNYKNQATTRTFNVWGGAATARYPDATTDTTTFAWGGAGLYVVNNKSTGTPATVTQYDALNREVRTGNQRFDGQWQYTDTEYDTFGRINRTSLPFRGASAAHWNTYAYDNYDRPTVITEASGKMTSWSYSGLSTTETKNGMATTRTTDATGVLVSVTDPGGTITYLPRPDGQPLSITAPGAVTTSFEYDAFGRQTKLIDPSAGQQTFAYAYTAAGVLTQTETNPKGKNISVFDKYGRITSLQRHGEFNTTYTYNTNGQLANETSTNGTSKTYTYDTYDRILTERDTVPDNKWLQKRYTYSGGNVSSIQYVAQSGTIGTENFTYVNGHNTEIKLGSTSVWKLTEENALGQFTKGITGTMERTYSYTTYGMPTGRTAGSIQSFTYSFDAQKGNLLSRKDNKHNKTETFAYDNLNRLTNAAGKVVTYAANGNITRIQGVGTMSYGNTAKPYQVTMLSPEGTAVPLREQSVEYTSFQRPSSIQENGVSASFVYNTDGDRVKMHVLNGTTPVLTRYYIGGQYELDATSNIERLYLGGDAYSAPAVYVKEAGSWKIYYICRDYLGSITHIANADGSLKQELSYDAWGRLRNPATQVAFASGSEPALFLGRGYTGHEHLTWFGLVNMNARLYDPALGRFLSPDPYVQMPDFTQNFNRYSYALNNPLVYVDPDGEFIHIIVGAIIGGAVNLTVKLVQGKVDNVWDGIAAFGIGAGGGALTAATGGAALAATGLSATSVLGGAITGVTGFATGGIVQNVGNHVYFGDPLMSGKDFAIGLATSAVGGGVIGGVSNKIWGKGTNFWTGKQNRPSVFVENPAQTSVQGPDGKVLKSSALDSNPTPKNSDYVSSSQGGGDAIEGIYEFKAASGKTYIGQSENIPARLQQHIKSGKLLPNTAVKTTEILGGKTAREIAEQLRINTLGGVKVLENVRNPIGAARQYLLSEIPK